MCVILGGFSANCATQDKPCETTEAPTASIFNAVKKNTPDPNHGNFNKMSYAKCRVRKVGRKENVRKKWILKDLRNTHLNLFLLVKTL